MALCVGLIALAGCGKGRDWRQTPAPAPVAADAEAGYVRPPQVLSAQRGTDGVVVLTGKAEPNSRVRLLTPDGSAYGGTVTAAGVWSMPTPPGIGIYGLSEDLGGRIVQGEGYVVVLTQPGRPAALLRAGGGAEPLGSAPGGLSIAAADFDTGGGTVVSGFAPAGVGLRLMVDGAAAPGEVKADPGGRFFIGSPVMLRPGSHQIRVQGASQAAAADIAVSPPGPISGSPYRATRQGAAWRVDWTTPGGGVQTSLILDP
ncbi:MAG TPA: hypothetical protein VGI79_03825 [Caulobacteraceae bacterium]